MSNHDDLTEAAKHWNEGNTLEAGKIIFENLPNDKRPVWAAQILKFAVDNSGTRNKEIDRVLDIAATPKEWKSAKNAFSKIRDLTLDIDKKRNRGLRKEQEVLGWVLALAELVAKVTYNATDPIDEFDEDSGWWVAQILKGFLDLEKDDGLSKAAWLVLRGQH